MMSLGLLFIGCSFFTLATAAGPLPEEDWGDGLKVKILYRPDDCVEGAQANDIIHYHYVGRLFDSGEEFGKRLVAYLVAYSMVIIHSNSHATEHATCSIHLGLDIYSHRARWAES